MIAAAAWDAAAWAIRGAGVAVVAALVGTGGAGGGGARAVLEWSGAVACGRSARGGGEGCAWVGDGGVQASAGVAAAA